jgi:hypothetical protein
MLYVSSGKKISILQGGEIGAVGALSIEPPQVDYVPLEPPYR